MSYSGVFVALANMSSTLIGFHRMPIGVLFPALVFLRKQRLKNVCRLMLAQRIKLRNTMPVILIEEYLRSVKYYE